MKMQNTILKNFFVFEGIDGSGTSSQIKAIQERAKEAKLPLVTSFEPTDGPIGTLIRSSLKGKPLLHKETVARLFSADRNEHLYGSGGVVETIEKGNIALSDRYIFSSLAYQGLTCGIADALSFNADFPLPEILFYFDVPAVEAGNRLKNRAELDMYENLPFQEKVTNMYRAVIDIYRNTNMKIITIDATRPIPEVSDKIWAEIQNHIIKH